MKILKTLLLSLLTCTVFQARASHIIGGEISYACLGGDNYLVTLIIYRDCTSFTPFDNPAYMTVYYQDGTYYSGFPMYSPTITSVPAESDNPCLVAPADICVEQAIYVANVTLPASELGYLLVYQRCCRNASIVNIDLPDNTGATYTQEVPPSTAATCNTAPVFNDFPPTVICLSDPIVFDHSATDLDGDSLYYDFYWPYQGASAVVPAPVTASAPPYTGVVYMPGYSETYPLDATPAFSIDHATGLLTGTATAEGRYVVGIICKEYRDGVWLGDHIRDFQFNVVSCTPAVVAQYDIDGIVFADVDPDTPYINCEDFNVIFDNFSTGGTSYAWDFGDGSTSTLEDPTHVYADTGTYTVTLIVNPGFTCADTAIGTIMLYNILTADFTYSAGCSGTPVEFNDNSNSTEAGTIINWDWNLGDGTTSGAANPVHEYADGGTYTVILTVTTDKGCQSTVMYDIVVEPGPSVDFSVEDICQNETAHFNNLTTIATGTISSYSWDFGDGSTSAEDEPDHNYAAPGTYTVTLIATSANGCSDTISHDIHVGELPFADAGPDATVDYLADYTMAGSGVGTFVWTAVPPLTGEYDTISNPFIAEPVVSLEQTTTFYLTVTSPDGCTETDTVTIFVTDVTIIEVPNAFSPNGDNVNDVVSVLGHEIAELLEYSIYDRWGEQVFTTTDIGKGWDGKLDSGKDAPVGTYVYVVRAKGLGDELFERQGNITLVR